MCLDETYVCTHSPEFLASQQVIYNYIVKHNQFGSKKKYDIIPTTPLHLLKVIILRAIFCLAR